MPLTLSRQPAACVILLLACVTCSPARPETRLAAPATANSLGMKMVTIPAGQFAMGQADGNFDEKPVHRVTIAQPFRMSATEVTNAQYEQFDPKHRRLRGKRGFAKHDHDAVVFVSWD